MIIHKRDHGASGEGIEASVDVDLTGAAVDIHIGGGFYLAEGSGTRNAFAAHLFDPRNDLMAQKRVIGMGKNNAAVVEFSHSRLPLLRNSLGVMQKYSLKSREKV